MTLSQTDSERVLTIGQISRGLGCATRSETIRNAFESGILEGYKIQPQTRPMIRIFESSIREYLVGEGLPDETVDKLIEDMHDALPGDNRGFSRRAKGRKD